MDNRFLVDPRKCSGCRTCEMVCSLKHEGVLNPVYSRVNIIKWEADGVYVPVMCQQCEDPVCLPVCPVKAITRSREKGLRRNGKKCIGCLNCAMVCPFGAISFDRTTKKAQSCDLCDGDPTCVKICPTGALIYGPYTQLNRRLRDKIAEFLIYDGFVKRRK